MIKAIFYDINYVWRVIATGLCFSIFGIGGLILGAVIIPVILLFIGEVHKKKAVAQHAISLSFRLFVFALSSTGLMIFKFEHLEKLKEDQGCLIIANHPTLIDYVVIVSKLSHCDTVVKEKLWHNPFMKHVIQSAGYIPNVQPEKTFEQIKETLSAGNNLLIFPEGTRTTPGEAIKLKRGAAQIVLREQCPIRVISISCLPSTLTKQNKWYQIPKIKPEFTLTVGERIDIENHIYDTSAPSLAARNLTRYFKKTLEMGLNHE